MNQITTRRFEILKEDVELVSMAVQILETVASLRSVAICLCFINFMDIDALFCVTTQVYADSKTKIQNMQYDYTKLNEKLKTG